MKKVLLLISLSLFLGLSVRSEVDVQALCKEQREKVNEAIKVISTIQDKSIKDFLYQKWTNPMLETIIEQSTSKEIIPWLDFSSYYNLGLSIAYQKIDKRVQAYKKEYDRLPDWKKNKTVNPYEPLFIKIGADWHFNTKNYMSFYFSIPNRSNQKYTINNLRKHLQEYVDCTQVTKVGEKIEFTDKVVKFFNDNKLLAYNPQNLADWIIEVTLELKRVKYATNDVYNHFGDSWACNCILIGGLHKNITLQEATEQITTAVHVLSPFKYNDVMEALNIEFKQKGMPDCIANYEADKKLNSIIQIYANKLVEKARR